MLWAPLFLYNHMPRPAPRIRDRILVKTIVYTTFLEYLDFAGFERCWHTTLPLEDFALWELNFQSLGGSMLGRELQSHMKSAMAASGSLTLLMKMPLRSSWYSAKSASSVLGLLGGDLGEGVGEFRHVEFWDIRADAMGDTLAEVRHEVSLWASLSIRI